MNYFFIRVAITGIFLSTIGACTAGNYDLPACDGPEKCGNGIDDDCDGAIDNPDICSCPTVGFRQSCPARVGIVTKSTNPASYCTDKTQLCLDDLQWDICRGIDPITEQCGNNRDDDCDGEVDEQDCVPCIDNQEQEKYDSTIHYSPISKCRPRVEVCKNGRWETKDAAVGPTLGDTTCDGKDDDCDGQVDEDAVWQSGTMSFKKGTSCWDISKVGACRTTGTVTCNGAGAFCSNLQRNPRSDFQNKAATDSLFDPNNHFEIWDWNCDGKIESIFCASSSSTCITSTIPDSKIKIIALDDKTDCGAARIPTCDNTVFIRSIIPGASIQCGSAVQIIDCGPPLFGLNCNNKSNPQDGYLYCR